MKIIHFFFYDLDSLVNIDPYTLTISYQNLAISNNLRTYESTYVRLL